MSKHYRLTHVQKMRQGATFKNAVRTGEIVPVRRTNRKAAH